MTRRVGGTASSNWETTVDSGLNGVSALTAGQIDLRRCIVVLPEIELVRSGQREADVLAHTQRCTAVIEEIMRRYPDQWIWFHKRWKTRPLGEAKIY